MENNIIRLPGSQPKIVHAPELPGIARLPFELGRDACQLLDEYIELSQKWSPRSYDGYHEGVFLWLLSTIAARRVAVMFGGEERYTNLYIILVGRSTLNAKSTAVKIAKKLLNKIGLDFLLLPDESTPQALIQDMTGKPPINFDTLPSEVKEKAKLKQTFAGQRGWYYDEFGMNIQLMMRKDGPFSEYKNIFRKFHDTEAEYSRATLNRGQDIVTRPYLALLGVLTPADLIPVSRKGSSLWSDGVFARMAFIVAPSNLVKKGRFPRGELIFPDSILKKLRQWHERLETPKVDILSGGNVKTVPGRVSKLEVNNETYEAFYRYDDALKDILITHGFPQDLDSNYGRLPEKALAIAGLFASLDNSMQIKINHWARAQEITERLRSNLHDLYKQVNTAITDEEQKKLSNEEKVKRAIREKNEPTSREIQQYTGLTAEDVSPILENLMNRNLIIGYEVGRTVRFRRTSESERESTRSDNSSQDENHFPDDYYDDDAATIAMSLEP